MEWIIPLGILAFLTWFLLFRGGKYPRDSRDAATTLMHIRLQKDRANSDIFAVYNLIVRGLAPITSRQSVELRATLYIYDEETGLPVFSNFSQTTESEISRVFCQHINFGRLGIGHYLPNWVNATNVIAEGLQPPYTGTRTLRFKLYYHDELDPIIFIFGKAVVGKDYILHTAECIEEFTFQEPGYRDEREHDIKVKPLMLEIAFNMGMIDGTLHQKEKEVIKKWMKSELDASPEEDKDRLKHALEEAVKASAKNRASDQHFQKIVQKFADIATKNNKYQAIELCLDVLSADGVADEAELKYLQELAKDMGLDFAEVQKMKDKALVKIDTGPLTLGQGASDESILGLSEEATKDEALAFIKKEYRKWNGRLNSLDAGTERDNAQQMLNALARLRKKYEQKSK